MYFFSQNSDWIKMLLKMSTPHIVSYIDTQRQIEFVVVVVVKRTKGEDKLMSKSDFGDLYFWNSFVVVRMCANVCVCVRERERERNVWV